MTKQIWGGFFPSVATALLGITFAPSAFACGGFFCDGANPVNQAAERIIFAKDGDTVVQIVEVMYEGDAEKFSWILPVPGIPEPAVSSVQAFDRLQQRTNPTYQLNASFPRTCDRGFPSGNDASAGGDGDGDGDEGGPIVSVVDSGSVGPFDYETISVDAGDEDPGLVAVNWLTENGYDPGPMGEVVLGPYLQNGLNLIAFRLQKGKSAGAIRPISLTYEANAMAIPIRPTAVAANADMPIMVWVLGTDRAVSTNYRGLELNELLIDWFDPNTTYNNVVIAAANEAGGQGFVTEFAGEAEQFAESIAPSWETENLEYYRDSADLQTAIVDVASQYGTFDGFLDVVATHVPLRSSVTPEEFLSCPYCYFYPGQYDDGQFGLGGAGSVDDQGMIGDSDPIYTTDLAAFLDAVELDVLLPIQETAELFYSHDYLTRFYTTMSADEMDKDPIFEFNPDLEDVSNAHQAEQRLSCDDDSWTITLENGVKVYGSGREWPYALDNTDLPLNVRVVQYGTSGDPDVIVDNTSQIQSLHGSNDAGTAPVQFKKRGCSYGAPTRSGLVFGWLLPLVALGVWVGRRKVRNS